LTTTTYALGYIAKADELKAAGIKEIICVAVNDPFVMAAWGQVQVRNIHRSALCLKFDSLKLDSCHRGVGGNFSVDFENMFKNCPLVQKEYLHYLLLCFASDRGQWIVSNFVV
jgi:hypothetical protein